MTVSRRHRIRASGRKTGNILEPASLKRFLCDADIGDVNGASMQTDQAPAALAVPKPAVASRLRRLALDVLERARGRSALTARASQRTSASGGWEEFHRELQRCRRYERRFAAVRVPLSELPLDYSADAQMRRAEVEEELLQRITNHLRIVDRAWLDGDAIYVVLPECDRSSAEAFVARLRRVIPDALADCPIAMVSFSEDGATSGALIAALQGHPIAGTPQNVASAGSRMVERKLGAGDTPAGASS